MADRVTMGIAKLIKTNGVMEDRRIQADAKTYKCIYYGINRGNMHRVNSKTQTQAILNLRRHFREKCGLKRKMDVFFVLSDKGSIIKLKEF